MKTFVLVLAYGCFIVAGTLATVLLFQPTSDLIRDARFALLLAAASLGTVNLLVWWYWERFVPPGDDQFDDDVSRCWHPPQQPTTPSPRFAIVQQPSLRH